MSNTVVRKYPRKTLSCYSVYTYIHCALPWILIYRYSETKRKLFLVVTSLFWLGVLLDQVNITNKQANTKLLRVKLQCNYKLGRLYTKLSPCFLVVRRARTKKTEGLFVGKGVWPRFCQTIVKIKKKIGYVSWESCYKTQIPNFRR